MHVRGSRCRRCRRPARLRGSPLVRPCGRRPRRRPAAWCRNPAPPSRRDRLLGDAGERQAHHPVAGRDRGLHRMFRTCRGLCAQPAWRQLQQPGRRDVRPCHARTDRRRRPHHAVEFPLPHPVRTGALHPRLRLHHRREAFRGHLCHDPDPGRGTGRGGPACGGIQRRHRVGRHHRAGAGRARAMSTCCPSPGPPPWGGPA